MKISDWLDNEETKSLDVSQLVLPDDLSYDEVPDETIFFEEINPCGILCPGNHPFSTVERFGSWRRIHERWSNHALRADTEDHAAQEHVGHQ